MCGGFDLLSDGELGIRMRPDFLLHMRSVETPQHLGQSELREGRRIVFYGESEF